MNFTRLTDELHRPGTPSGVRPAPGTPPPPAPLARATDGARPDDAARPGFRPTSRACHRSPARCGDGRTPSATFAHIASLAYLGFGWSLRARRFHRGNKAAALLPVPAAAATAVLGHLVTWPVRAAKPFRNHRAVMLAGAGQVREGSRHGALLEVGRVIVHGGDRRAGEVAMALMRMAACTQLGVDGWCLATPVGVAGRASGRSGVRPREL